jgi:hypothetical protein
MTRAYYSEDIGGFLQRTPDSLLGQLTQHHTFALEALQKHAWPAQFLILKQALTGLPPESHIFLEYSIPRMGKRVDVILLTGGFVFVIEFKVGEKLYAAHALDQVLDYSFTGTSWKNVADLERRHYLQNAYRVLLTRARQGMVIVVPPGDSTDKTRQREYYDGTFQYLKQLGLETI